MFKSYTLPLIFAACLAATTASAAVTDFEIDFSNSNVTITDQSSPTGLPDFLRGLTNCSISATIADGLSAPLSFSLASGESKTFDFLTLDVAGIGLPRDLALSATLAFTEPALTSSADATGSLFFFESGFLGGSFLGGVDGFDGAPALISLADGTMVEIAFGGFDGLMAGKQTSISATVSVLSAPPPPASFLLLASALAVMGCAGRRRLSA